MVVNERVTIKRATEIPLILKRLFWQDCNGDGIINCDDFAAIHQLGKFDCEDALPSDFITTYQSCRSIIVKYEAVDDNNN